MTTHPMTSDRHSEDARAKPTPRWLWPVLIGIPVVGALLAFGVISPTFVLYAALFGGCALMHVFGHGSHGGQGHEGHGSHGGQGHEAHHAAPDEDESLSRRSSGAQPGEST